MQRPGNSQPKPALASTRSPWQSLDRSHARSSHAELPAESQWKSASAWEGRTGPQDGAAAGMQSLRELHPWADAALLKVPFFELATRPCAACSKQHHAEFLQLLPSVGREDVSCPMMLDASFQPWQISESFNTILITGFHSAGCSSSSRGECERRCMDAGRAAQPCHPWHEPPDEPQHQPLGKPIGQPARQPACEPCPQPHAATPQQPQAS